MTYNHKESYRPDYKDKRMKVKCVQYYFCSNLDSFIGFFTSPSKIVDFVNKKYKLSCRKEQISKTTFVVKDKITNKIVGFIFPTRALRH